MGGMCAHFCFQKSNPDTWIDKCGVVLTMEVTSKHSYIRMNIVTINSMQAESFPPPPPSLLRPFKSWCAGQPELPMRPPLPTVGQALALCFGSAGPGPCPHPRLKGQDVPAAGGDGVHSDTASKSTTLCFLLLICFAFNSWPLPSKPDVHRSIL